MAGQPIAIIGSMHVCPMVTGTVPHVGGPVTGPGAPGVTVNGVPVSLMGDICTCVGAPDTIAQGCAGVTINGTPVATVGCLTAHGGSITVGSPGVLVGPVEPAANATMPVNSIPFPDISFVSKVLASVVGQGESLAEAQQNQEQLRSEAVNNEGEPVVYNLKWLKEDKVIRGSKVVKKVKLRASVLNVDDGQSVSFKIKRPVKDSDDDAEEDVVTLSGTVQDKKVEVEWEVEDNSNCE